MARADTHVRAAYAVAGWLFEQGEPKRANDVLAVLRSLSVARTTLRTLHRDNMELRAIQHDRAAA